MKGLLGVPSSYIYQRFGRPFFVERRKKLYYGTDVIPLPVCPVTTKSVSANGDKPVAGAEGGITASTPGGIVLLPFVRSRAQRDSTYSSMSTASSRGEASIHVSATGFRSGPRQHPR